MSPLGTIAIDLVRHTLATVAAGLLVPRTALALPIPRVAIGLVAQWPEHTQQIVGASSLINLAVVALLALWGVRPSESTPHSR